MIILGMLVSIAAIGTMCWLLFNLAVFALPFIIGLNAGTWAYGTGAGWFGVSIRRRPRSYDLAVLRSFPVPWQ